jgi:hypothetical protein
MCSSLGCVRQDTEKYATHNLTALLLVLQNRKCLDSTVMTVAMTNKKCMVNSLTCVFLTIENFEINEKKAVVNHKVSS